MTRRFPVGAEADTSGTSFRVWAPEREAVAVVLEGGDEHPLAPEAGGYFAGFIAGIGDGALYRLRLDRDQRLYADPASRFQPQGPEGPSAVVDASAYRWRDDGWAGATADDHVIYELHIGTLTESGTWASAADRLDALKALGVTLVEVMPINEFCGTFGWGYDGVLPYAPTRLYGTPDDLRAFIDRAHAIGLGVILDVVYNHFGVGDQFEAFSSAYFTDRHENDWGRSINYDGEGAAGVRDFIAGNAAYWISEYHFDGLRLDATQALFDDGDDHIIARIVRECRAAAGDRTIYIVAENEPQHSHLPRRVEQGGYGLDAVWNDDFHHAVMVALTGRSEAYYHDYLGAPQEFISAAKYGYLFQGQRYDWQNYPRGSAGLDLSPGNFVHFLENHDQVANSAHGRRLHHRVSPARLRAATALLLLGPQTPLLFEGQEFASSAPFLFFADHQGELGVKVGEGRKAFLGQFPSLHDEGVIDALLNPVERSTFDLCKLDWGEYERNGAAVALHRDLLTLRRERAAFGSAACKGKRPDGSVLGPSAFLLRFFADRPQDDCLLLVNFGTDLPVKSLADPLFAPPGGLQWEILWSSERAAYGGDGQRAVDVRSRFVLTGESAIVLATTPQRACNAPKKSALDAWQATISS